MGHRGSLPAGLLSSQVLRGFRGSPASHFLVILFSFVFHKHVSMCCSFILQPFPNPFTISSGVFFLLLDIRK